MRSRYVAASIFVVALSGEAAEQRADCPTKQFTVFSSSRKLISDLAGEPGAVYEVSVRIPPADLGEALSVYAKWFHPVDTLGLGAGRTLLTVLTREVGDEQDLVFLYWYEHPYKEHYYCEYTRAFFGYHLSQPEKCPAESGQSDQTQSTKCQLIKFYKAAATLMKEPEKPPEELIKDLVSCCHNDQVPKAASEAMRRVDQELRKFVTSSHSSWNFGINPCKVQSVRTAEMANKPVNKDELEECRGSLLEKALGKKERTPLMEPR